MLPHTALRTARPLVTARRPGSGLGAGAAGCRASEGPWKAVRAARRRRGSAGPGRTRIRWARPRTPYTPCTGHAARRAGPSRARGCIRSHRARTGRARGADTGWTRSRGVTSGARGRGRGATRRGRGGGVAGASDRRARELHVGGTGVAGASVPGSATIAGRYGNAPPPGPPIGVPQALARRPQDGQVRGACASGMREGGHSRWEVAALVVPRDHAPSAGCLGADRPRRCCPGDYLPLAASLSFEPAETFTL